MRNLINHALLITALCGCSFSLQAQSQKGLSTNPDKFLGNITTSGRVCHEQLEYTSLWNQLTAENESKWGSIEGQRHGDYHFQGSDNAYHYCKEHGIPFKFHCLIWGAQYPRWMDRLNKGEQRRAIEQWMDAVKERYPDLPLIDVVNEAVPGHQPAPFREALGGAGITGYDWIIRAFEMAHERWPNAILIYNDYNTFRWQKDEFIRLVTTLRDAGAPIDAYGCQSHELTDMSFDEFRQAMTDIQQTIRLPMYCTEYDIATPDDSLQLRQYEQQISYMWEQDYCAGITLWGYIYGRTWTKDGNSGLIRQGEERPALKWLRQYMQTPEACTARSPFPGMLKEASLYIKPSTICPKAGQTVAITVSAQLRSKKIAQVTLYMDGAQLGQEKSQRDRFVNATWISKPVSATREGSHELRAVLTTDDGASYERIAVIKVSK